MRPKTIQFLGIDKQARIIPLVVVIAVVIALSIDMYFAKFYGFSQTISSGTIGIFLILSAICIGGQQVILRFVKFKSKTVLENSKKLRLMFKSITIAQYIISSIFISLILQVYFLHHYSSVAAVLATIIAYSFSITVLALLTQQFVSWYRTNRHRVVLMYTLASGSLCSNLIIAIIIVSILSQDINPTIYPSSSRFIPNAPEILNAAYIISTSLAFSLTWIATAMLMRHYSKKMGSLLYWILMALPLTYFLGQFVFIFLNTLPILSDVVSSVVFVMTFFSLSKPIGGALFGAAFWEMSRKLNNQSIRDFMFLACFGFVLFFLSNQIIGTALPLARYPPFGFMEVLFTSLSSYMIMIGIFASAISISEDIKIRQLIRNSIGSESKLLDNIGSSRMEQELQKRVTKITRSQELRMIEETGVQSSMNDEEIRGYFYEVLKEIKKRKHE